MPSPGSSLHAEEGPFNPGKNLVAEVRLTVPINKSLLEGLSIYRYTNSDGVLGTPVESSHSSCILISACLVIKADYLHSLSCFGYFWGDDDFLKRSAVNEHPVTCDRSASDRLILFWKKVRVFIILSKDLILMLLHK